MSVPGDLARLYPTATDLAERLRQAELEPLLRRAWVPRGTFPCRLVNGRVVTVTPADRRPDVGERIYEVAEGEGAARRIVAYVRGPLPAADVTAEITARLAARLLAARTAAPPAAGTAGARVATYEIETMRAGVKERRRQRLSDRYFRQKGGLTGRQWAAGDRLSLHYEAGPQGARDPGSAGSPPAGREPPLGQLAAIRAFEAALAALGRRLADIVSWVVLHERSVESWAARHEMDRKHGMGILKVALDILADHYGEPGGDPDERRRLRADPPPGRAAGAAAVA